MLGAIAGDIVGAVYEWANIKTKQFPLFARDGFFTDDSVLTVALADSTLTGTPGAENSKTFFQLYLDAGAPRRTDEAQGADRPWIRAGDARRSS